MGVPSVMTNNKVVLGSGEYGDVIVEVNELVGSRALVQGSSGSGKSQTLRKLIELTRGRLQQLVFDVEGEYVTLRETFDDYIIVGKDADAPCHPATAKVLARKLLEVRASAVIDMSELQAHDRVRFVRYFLEALVAAPQNLRQGPVLVVIDEAHLFAPQDGSCESTPAVIDLCARGRKRGLVPVLATQRLSKLHKDATAELANVLIGRTVQDVDQKRAADVLGFTGRLERVALRDLEPGEFYAFGPALPPGITKLKVALPESRHPKAGELVALRPSAPTTKVREMLAALGDLPEQAAEEARTVEELRAENGRLKRDLTAAKREQRVETAPCDHEPVIDQLRTDLEEARTAASDYQIRLSALDHDLLELPGIVEAKVLELIGRTDNPPKRVNLDAGASSTVAAAASQERTGATSPPEGSLPPRRYAASRQGNAGSTPATGKPDLQPTPEIDIQVGWKPNVITNARQKIIDAIAAFEPLGLSAVSKSVVAAYAGVSPKSGGFRNNLGALRSSGLIEYPSGNFVALTESGRALVTGSCEPIHDLGQLHDAWLDILKSSSKVRLVSHLIDVYPSDIEKSALAAACAVSETSGGYRNNLGALRSLGLLEYPRPGFVRATSLLFPEGVPA